MNFITIRATAFFLTVFVVVIAIILSPNKLLASTANFARRFYPKRDTASQASHLTTTSFDNMSTSTRTPVYFFGHGGPNLVEDVNHPAFLKLAEMGREITQKVKPKAVVVFSAHWQGEPNLVEINTSEMIDLIYDFYGFPAHLYEEKYPHVGSKSLAETVMSCLNSAGIRSKPVRRGLDHGVWTPFKAAFDPEKNPLNVPIVQVSLYGNDDPTKHIALGRAIASLREKGVLIICSGTAVHNLRDLRYGFSKVMPYATTFDEALRDAVEADPTERDGSLTQLLWRKDARQAHPSFEHILPIHVAAGAAGDDKGKRLFTRLEGSVSWAQFRFGEVSV